MSYHTNHFSPKTKRYVSLLNRDMSARIFLDWIDDIGYALEYYDLYGIECLVFAQRRLSRYAMKL